MSRPLTLPAATTVAAAATIIDDTNAVVGLVALEDLSEEIVGEFDDETDRPAT